METIKVNMNPNPLDVQTIHASQNDGEARQWEFELHNNGEKIDSSSISDQLVFKAYEGGTEEILPTNGSTPTTVPFKGDIKYPQGLLSDQEFLYRESPTEEDGLAKITDIKGNTLNWNQLVQNGNFADTSEWSAESGATLSISNNIATISSTTANNGIRQYFPIPLTVGHKYLIKAEFNVPTEYRCAIGTAGNQGVQIEKLISTANTWTEVIGVGTCTVATTTFYCFVKGTTYENVKVRNVMCFDLTQMGLDITYPSDFTSLFPLSYYSYNQGTLLSFMGNGIKTVGANILDLSSEFDRVGVSYTVDEDGWFTVTDIAYPSLYRNRFLLPSALTNGSALIEIDTSKTASTNFIMVLYNDTIRVGTTTTKLESKAFDRISFDWSTPGSTTFRVMVTTMPTIGTYEPYTESTTDIPISTYFPNGMKSAGTVYDELTPIKAITRIGAIDLGSITYTRQESQISGVYFFVGAYNSIPNIKNRSNSLVWNIKTPLYETVPSTRIYQGFAQNKTIGGYDAQTVRIRDDSFTDATAFKNSLSGQYLVFELATPTETSFTTASLVKENAEIPLSNEDGTLIGKCTEELSAEPGFHDAKIKLSDSDGECYSNKIQIHVERKPS